MRSSNTIGNHLTRATLLVAVASLALLTNPVAAQEKGATKLMQLKLVQSTTPRKADDTVAMSCPKCKDSWVTVVEKTFKAVQPEIKHRVLRHECPGCATSLVTEGHGKAKTTRAVHVCKECGSKDAFCCATKKGAGPTLGMEHSGPQH